MCSYIKSAKGCGFGEKCKFLHPERSSNAAAPVGGAAADKGTGEAPSDAAATAAVGDKSGKDKAKTRKPVEEPAVGELSESEECSAVSGVEWS